MNFSGVQAAPQQQVQYPRLKLTNITIGLGLNSSVQQQSYNVPMPVTYDFKVEVEALSVISNLEEKASAEKTRKEGWLKTRADKRRDKEISALKQMEEDHNRKQQEQKRQAEEAAQRAEAQRLAQKRQAEEAQRAAQQAKVIAEQQAKLKKQQDEAKKLNAWHNAQLDITGSLLTPTQVQAVRHFQSMCGVQDDAKSIKLLLLSKWNLQAAINHFFSGQGIDQALAGLEPRPPQPQSARSMVQLNMPDGKQIQQHFAVTDTLWALFAFVQQNVNNNNFSLHSGDKCLTATESGLNQTFLQAGFPPGPLHIVQVRML